MDFAQEGGQQHRSLDDADDCIAATIGKCQINVLLSLVQFNNILPVMILILKIVFV